MIRRSVFLLCCGAFVLATLCFLALEAEAEPQPWLPPSDTTLALRDPDHFAWLTFIAINWPADLGRKAADPALPLGSPVPVVWESWRLASDIYRPNAERPANWDESGEVKHITDDDDVPLQRKLLTQTQPVPPGDAGHQHDEVRYNRAAFEYVMDNKLYAVEEQEVRFYRRQSFQFPTDALVVKAVWRPIAEEEKPRYHWAMVQDGRGGSFLYGLASLHLMSKVLPDWFWATFEHIDNPFRAGIHDEGWLLPSRDTIACPPHDLACNKAPAGFGLEGTCWENYRLRGTQTSFTDSYGRPILLANSELETGFQRTASCMTCHARATIGPRLNHEASFEFGPAFAKHPLSPPDVDRLAVFRVLPDDHFESYNGVPDPAWFALPPLGASRWNSYLQLDYAWSLARAQHRISYHQN